MISIAAESRKSQQKISHLEFVADQIFQIEFYIQKAISLVEVFEFVDQFWLLPLKAKIYLNNKQSFFDVSSNKIDKTSLPKNCRMTVSSGFVRVVYFRLW